MYKNNLWRALLQLFNSPSLIVLIINIDRFGNALCAGHYRATVSARVGWFEVVKNNRYWSFLGKVIDETFRPIDGPNHCYKAYLWEKNRNKEAGRSVHNYRRGNDAALALLGVVVIAACFVLMPVIYIVAAVKGLWANFWAKRSK